MQQSSRRGVAAGEARTRILDAAADCIVRDGLAQVRMAAIARTADVSSGLVHYHFETKERLFAAVLGHSSTLSQALTEEALGRAGTQPAPRLAILLDRCLPIDTRLTRDWLLWRELDLLCMRQPDLADVGAHFYGTLHVSAADIISAGIEEEVFDLDPEHALTIAKTAVALCDGLGFRILALGSELSLDAARRMVALAVGRLVGHDGPLPHPAEQREEA